MPDRMRRIGCIRAEFEKGKNKPTSSAIEADSEGIILLKQSHFIEEIRDLFHKCTSPIP
jgi:hypothetical protein